MKDAIMALLRSRKFLLTMIAILQALVMEYFGISPEVWQPIAAILVALVASIAYEDGKTKEAVGAMQHFKGTEGPVVTVQTGPRPSVTHTNPNPAAVTAVPPDLDPNAPQQRTFGGGIGKFGQG